MLFMNFYLKEVFYFLIHACNNHTIHVYNSLTDIYRNGGVSVQNLDTNVKIMDNADASATPDTGFSTPYKLSPEIEERLKKREAKSEKREAK